MNVNSSGSVLSHCSDVVPSGNVLDLTYGYGSAGGNNGNVVTFSATGAQRFNRTYSYDWLDRLTAMSAPGDSCSGLSWQYDPWANRTAQSVSGGTCHTLSAASTTQNQLVGYQYDAAGNMISDGTHTYIYDAESRVTKVDSGNTASYVYNGAGERVQKNTSSAQTNYWLDLDGNTAVEWNQNSNWMVDYIYVNGVLLAQYEAGTTVFVQRDHLGSTRLITALNQSVSDSMDYLPFGEQILGAMGTTHKFTGKERDAESGLDDFGARYYASALGRFVTPDWSAMPVPAPYADLTDPQTLNQYSYVRNIPTVKVDADGHDGCCTLSDLARLVDEGVAEGRAMIAALKPAAPAVPAAGSAIAAAGPAAVLALPSVGAMTLVVVMPPVQNHPADDPPNAGDMMLDALSPSYIPAPSAPQTATGGNGAKDGGNNTTTTVSPGPDGMKKGSSNADGVGKPFSEATKNGARAESGDKCVFCGRHTSRQPGPDQSNIDHANPRSRGGDNSPDNAQNTCRTCNQDKGTRTTDEYLRDRRQNPH